MTGEPGISETPADAAGRAALGDRSYLYIRPRPRGSRWRAVAYSRFVALMKVILPAVALSLVVLVGIWPYLQAEDTSFRIGFSALKARDVMGPRMVNPRYVGVDEESRPFTVTADLARDAAEGGAADGTPTVVELDVPKADITLEDGSWLVLTSDSGVFRRDQRNLSLSGSVTLFHDSGYEIIGQTAKVDLRSGEASSDQPVVGHGPFGELEAEGFRLHDKGKVINFDGKARLVLHPGEGDPIW